MSLTHKISVGDSVFTEPAFYLDGKRIQPKNLESADDIIITNPATGFWNNLFWSKLIYLNCYEYITHFSIHKNLIHAF